MTNDQKLKQDCLSLKIYVFLFSKFNYELKKNTELNYVSTYTQPGS